jgi:hypothetical protein
LLDCASILPLNRSPMATATVAALRWKPLILPSFIPGIRSDPSRIAEISGAPLRRPLGGFALKGLDSCSLASLLRLPRLGIRVAKMLAHVI